MAPQNNKKKNSKKNRAKNKKEDDNSNRINSDDDVSKTVAGLNLNSNSNPNGWTDPSLLRFRVGTKVECNTDKGWVQGKIIKQNFKHEGWDHYVPYEMVLLKDNNHNNHTANRSNSSNKYDYSRRGRRNAPKDTDDYIREAFFIHTKEKNQTKGWTDPSLLRFRVGTKVECRTTDNHWLFGKIIEVNFKEDDWDHYVPYQIVLLKDNNPNNYNHNNYDYMSRIYAPTDCDNDIIEFQTKEQKQTEYFNQFDLTDYPKSNLFDVGWDLYHEKHFDVAADAFKRGAENDGCVSCMFKYIEIQFFKHDNPHLALPWVMEGLVRGHIPCMEAINMMHNKAKPLPAAALANFCTKILYEVDPLHTRKGEKESRENVKKVVANYCYVCNKDGSESNENNVILEKCGNCKYFSYCGKKCQTYHWKECNHIGECRQVSILRQYCKPRYVEEIRKAICRGDNPKEIDRLQTIRTKLGLNRPKEQYEELVSLLDKKDDSNSTKNSNIMKRGAKVKVKGLVKASIHNGKLGSVTKVSSIPGQGRRVGVKLSDDSGTVLAIKVENLELLSATMTTNRPNPYEYLTGRKDGTVHIGSTPNVI